MPQHNERFQFRQENQCVSEIDYSEAQTVLDLTTTKQKQMRRKRGQALYTQLLLKRTYVHICNLLDSDCSSSSSSVSEKPLPLSTIDTNKRKISSNNQNEQSVSKKTKISSDLVHIDEELRQFLRELNAVKVTPRY